MRLKRVSPVDVEPIGGAILRKVQMKGSGLVDVQVHLFRVVEGVEIAVQIYAWQQAHALLDEELAGFYRASGAILHGMDRVAPMTHHGNLSHQPRMQDRTAGKIPKHKERTQQQNRSQKETSYDALPPAKT